MFDNAPMPESTAPSTQLRQGGGAGHDPLRIVSWNFNRKPLWDHPLPDGFGRADLVLAQEAPAPLPGIALASVPAIEEPWTTEGWKSPRRAGIAALASRVALQPTGFVEGTYESVQGAIAVADAVVADHRFTVASLYAKWEELPEWPNLIFAHKSALRLLEDLARHVDAGAENLVAAGDLNILYRYGEHGDDRWAEFYSGVFDRAEELGIPFVGPQAPNGRQADPWPDELPEGSLCVPTYHHNRQTPQTATRQLDFVFASEAIKDRVRTRALNEVSEWGPSDHCRVLVEVDLMV